MPRPLTRSSLSAGIIAAALALPLVLLDDGAARAADPELETFLEAVQAAAQECDEYVPNQWLCIMRDGDVYAYTDLIRSDGGLTIQPTAVFWDAGRPVPLDAELYSQWSELVTLALGADSEAHAWLAEMNEGPKPSGEFSSDGWQLSWSSRVADGAADVGLNLFYWPDSGPSNAPAPPVAIPSFAPVDPPASSLGEWTYEGTWTLTAQVNDAGLAPDPPLGTSSSATLSITCEAADRPCSVSLATESGARFTYEAELVEAGRLRAMRQREPDDCPGPETETETFDIDHGTDAAIGVLATVSEPRSCELESGMHHSVDSTFTFSGALTSFVGAGEPVESGASAPSAQPAPAEPGSGGSGGPHAPVIGEPFADAVATVGEISTDPAILLQSAFLAALLVFLMPFPSQLFNSTLEAHEDDVRRWLRLDRLGAIGAGVGTFWASWPGVAAFTLLAAVLYGLLDPGFGIGFGSLATLVGMLLGIVLVTAAFAVPAVLAHRRIGSTWALKVVPISLLIGVACVLLSRLTGFQPGYLYGLLIGLAFARELSAADEGRATAIGAIAMLSVAFASWLALGALPEGGAFGLVVARTTLAALMVAGLEGVVFGLLPMRFLPGEPLYAWNRVAWGVLLAIGAFAFFHILINPASGYLSDTSRTPLLTMLSLLIGFSLVSVAFWAWFRFRAMPLEAQASDITD